MEKRISLQKITWWSVMFIIIGIITMIGQVIRLGTPLSESFAGMLVVSLVSLFALCVRNLLPASVPFPAFAWASLTAFLLSTPFSPIQEFFLETTNGIDFLATTTPILAYAGIAVGDKLKLMGKLSWKIILLAFIVFTSTYLGSALIAHILLKANGNI